MEKTNHAQLKSGALHVRSLVGLGGVFVAAMTAGLNSRAGFIGSADIRGALSFGLDDFSWVTTSYAAGELVVMPFASWFAVTFTMRGFHLAMVAIASAFALLIPSTESIITLCVMRFLQGVAAGGLIPLLMSAALRILPLSLRLHGLALYAMTATFIPNISVWLVGQWTDIVVDWRWIYWQFLLFAPMSAAMVWWGFPKEHIQWSRFNDINLRGLATGFPGLIALAIGVDQGNRLDWFNSPLISFSLTFGLISTALYVLTEWHHPMPFVKIQLLGRRNLGLLFTAFIFLLIVFTSGSTVPSTFLSLVWGYRSLENAPVALFIGVPQLLLGSLVAVLIYQRWVDARLVFASGLCIIAAACFLGARLQSNWIWTEFLTLQILHAVGQPMAIVSLLFLTTSVVHPSEGPYISGCVNTFRALGALLGGALVGRVSEIRQHFHSEILIDHFGSNALSLPQNVHPTELASLIGPEVITLATADIYRLLGWLAVVLVPVVLMAQYIPAPDILGARKQKTNSELSI